MAIDTELNTFESYLGNINKIQTAKTAVNVILDRENQ